MPEESTQARIMGQIERMAGAGETPTNDVHAWIEVQLAQDPEILRKLSPQAMRWLEQFGLL